MTNIDMKAAEEISFELDVIAAIPGEYTGPASNAYLIIIHLF